MHFEITLYHEIFDDTMEGGSLVALWHPVLAMLPRAELTEVLSSLGNHVSKQLNLHATHVLSSDGYIEEHHWIGLVTHS